MTDKRKAGRVEEWSFVKSNDNPYTAPELLSTLLQGKLYGDERCSDGMYVTTSYIVKICLTTRTVETKNSLYHLGEIDSKFNDYLVENNYDLKEYEKVNYCE